ncbi:hypothetical protein, variant [Blastomyces dermatitidis ER-3]|uniref:Uncharacterized protein n=1 Tax=Ajellomyces dermatitidis (strain ER-3 / ATCC MYA-2586) TaxID=559297 RepID=A0ABX2VUJ1_AJEDR|nr:uncharacterized protein BDCG_02597 [Blastomyces dermatitidis ER-3]XP_045280105.1 hypothetical protein, variant [Blastomyces dermatitidis ER-3]OAT00377.1 hypothetical protein BDCG_02597 [Blastomyces dermatitidis ER-3]OAT00378.1 hypothetical protein, variant [Blastomyces dermatitidis ER-3]
MQTSPRIFANQSTCHSYACKQFADRGPEPAKEEKKTMSKHALCLKSALTGLLFLAASRRRKRSESGQVGRKTMFDCRMAPLPQAPAACPDPRSTHEPPSRHGLRWSEDRQDRSSPSTNAVGWCGAGMSYVIFFLREAA